MSNLQLFAGLPDFLGKTYQNGKNVPKREKCSKTGKMFQNGKSVPQNVPNNHKMYKMAVCMYNIPPSSIARPSKIYPNWYFWFENMPSGNPGYLFKTGEGNRVP
jgi:hypothetical protein